MKYTIRHISDIINGKLIASNQDDYLLSDISFDSRKINDGASTLFFALKGLKSDGHDYLSSAYAQGVRNFVATKKVTTDDSLNKANFILVSDTLVALQLLARHHRQQLDYPIAAITGSNGKTMVKEWLALALQEKRTVTKTPLSYNSQIGVPYSVLKLNPSADIAIIEAGVSEKKEMEKLANILSPEIGIFTTLGDAHDSGFSSREEKLEEKLSLFSSAELLIYNEDQTTVAKKIKESYATIARSWGEAKTADLRIVQKKTVKQNTELDLSYGHQKFTLRLPFVETAFIENSMAVIMYLILDGWQEDEINAAISKFSTLPNRLEIRKGHNNCLLLNDSYSADLASMQLALAYLQQYGKGKKKIAFLSKLEHQKEEAAYRNLLQKALYDKKIDELITIGFSENTLWEGLQNPPENYEDVSACLNDYNFEAQQDAIILIKGASRHKLGVLMSKMTQQVSNTILETNLSAIAHNLNVYRKRLHPSTLIMAIVKAQAYGSGSLQLSEFLATQKVDYLGVALVDEAIALRNNGCELPLMIFNVQLESLSRLWQYNLEPEVFSFELLEALIEEAKNSSKNYNHSLSIHLKIDSGMHRLGFTSEDLPRLISLLQNQEGLVIKSIFSHLSASETAEHDAFTQSQLSRFEELYQQLTGHLSISPLRHILNTSGVLRFPDHQYDLVRIGLGLYGIDESRSIPEELQKAHKLKAVVLQVKRVKAGETTGYSRSGKIAVDTDIAVLSIGYADGLMRAAGNGAHKVQISSHLCPTIGNICMDVCMVALPQNHTIKVGDEAIIIGERNPVENLATACNTITYEIISRISPRVKRTYVQD